MTRKHFEALALALSVTNASVETCALVANVCRASNSRCDLLRFMDAACAPGWNNGEWSVLGGFLGPEYLAKVAR